MAEKPVFLDTNVFLRFLTRDDPRQAEACRGLFERAEAGQLRLTTSHLALAEIVWTLESHYRLSRDEIAGTLRDLLGMKSFTIERKGMLRNAVALYASTNVDFVDAYHAAHLRSRKIPAICSFDRDFESLSITRVEPDAVK
ncbi:MAG: type II toxin-antitoxin system VapC family toxin [Chloroflexi bacterium]|nr:type II toxin-antitoxin system VapC family toxin [Chloroflexota bacterium]